MQPAGSPQQSTYHPSARSIGRIASVTGSKAIVLLDTPNENDPRSKTDRPEMGMLLAIDTANAIVLANVSALSVPVPAQGAENEIRIAELGLVGELTRDGDGKLSASAAAPRPIRRWATACAWRRNPSCSSPIPAKARKRSGSDASARIRRSRPSSGSMICSASISRCWARPAPENRAPRLSSCAPSWKRTRTRISCCSTRTTSMQRPSAKRAEVVSPRNMQLPLWLLNFEETIEVLVGDVERKAEIEILHELIPVAKARYSGRPHARAAAAAQGRLRSEPVHGRYARSIPHLGSHHPDRRAHGQAREPQDLAPYRQLKTRIETLTQDGRYAFMFGSLTVYDGMAQVLSRLFRACPVNGQADHHRRADGASARGRERGRVGLVPHGVRLRALGRGPGAGDGGVRGSAPLRAAQPADGLSSPASAPSPRSPRKGASTAPRFVS